MPKKHVLSKKVRRRAMKLLNYGCPLEKIPSQLIDVFPDFITFNLLPEAVRKEFYLLEARSYLKCHPDVTKDERRLIRAWARVGHNPWSVIWRDVYDGCELNMDFLDFERYLLAEGSDILPLCSKNYADYEKELPF